MANLSSDIQKCLYEGLSLVHLTAEPVSVKEVASVFGLNFENRLERHPIEYNFKSIYAHLWQRADYQYTREDSLNAIREYSVY